MFGVVALACGGSDPVLFQRILGEVTRQISGHQGGNFLLYPEERKEASSRRLVGLSGLMDHQQLIRRKYQDKGVHVTAERQQYDLPRVPKWTKSHGRRTYETQDYISAAGVVLTTNNTRPIRVVANYDAFSEENVEPYTLCFKIGDWFKIGNPSSKTPPADGRATCLRPPITQGYDNDCWALCEADDVPSAEEISCMKQQVDSTLPIFSQLLRVPRLTNDRLRLTVSQGSYPTYFASLGFDGKQCFADCTKTVLRSTFASADRYCTQGVDADAIVFVRKAPVVKGAAGFGGSCSVDQFGRPIGMFFSWGEQKCAITTPAVAGDLAKYQQKARDETTIMVPRFTDRSTHLILHEVMHGLGFTSASWVHNGKISKQRFVDVDGTVDEVYAFNSDTKTHSLMKTYFGCDRDDVRMPLMGYPAYGRDSHQSNRLVPEDVMSYAGGGAISSFTLAMMEDMGVYLANYSAADAIQWGRGQGCAFVTSRCEARPGNVTVAVDTTSVASKAKCGVVWVSEQWSSNMGWSDFASRMRVPLSVDVAQAFVRGVGQCAPHRCGSIVCSSSGLPGSVPCAVQPAELQWDVANTLKNRCSKECYYDNTVVLGDGGNVIMKELQNLLGGKSFQDYLWLLYTAIGCLVIGGLVFRCILHKLFASQDIIRRNSTIIASFGLLIAIGVVGAASYNLDMAGIAKEATGGSFTGVLLAGGVCTAVYCAAEIYIVGKHHDYTCTLACLMAAGSLVLLIQAAAVALLVVWSSSIAKLPEQVNAADGGGRWQDQFFDKALGELEHFSCETYRTCCRDPLLASAGAATAGGTSGGAFNSSFAGNNATASTTCTSMPEQATNSFAAAQLTVQDPSQPGFCRALSGGARYAHKGVSQSTCAFLGSRVSGFDQPKCQAAFCADGLRGYHEFLTALVDAASEWLVPGVALVAFLAMVQLLQIFYFRAMRNHAIKQRKPRGCCCCYEDSDKDTGGEAGRGRKDQKAQKKPRPEQVPSAGATRIAPPVYGPPMQTAQMVAQQSPPIQMQHISTQLGRAASNVQYGNTTYTI